MIAKNYKVSLQAVKQKALRMGGVYDVDSLYKLLDFYEKKKKIKKVGEEYKNVLKKLAKE